MNGRWQVDGLQVATFQVDRRSLRARRPYQPRGHHLEPGDGGLVDAGRPRRRGHVHRLAPIPGDAVADELAGALERKSVVEGKSVSVRVDLGGRRVIKKKIKK